MKGKEIKHKDGTIGGYLVGRSHDDGGIKAKNIDTDEPLELEGEEVIITKAAVKDPTPRQFQGKMMTNREILSQINQDGGGVAFEDGGETARCACGGHTYELGGNTLTDKELFQTMAAGGDAGTPAQFTRPLLYLSIQTSIATADGETRYAQPFKNFEDANNALRGLYESGELDMGTPQTWVFSLYWADKGQKRTDTFVMDLGQMDLKPGNAIIDPRYFTNIIGSLYLIHTLAWLLEREGLSPDAPEVSIMTKSLLASELEVGAADANHALRVLSDFTRQNERWDYEGNPALTVSQIWERVASMSASERGRHLSFTHKFGLQGPESVAEQKQPQWGSSNMAEGGTVSGFDPQTVLQQLGGNHFIVMTGARNFVADRQNAWISFRIGRNATSANYVKIRLNSMDTYDMEFGRIRKGTYTVLETYNNIYADQLQEIFTDFTGLYTRLEEGGQTGVTEAAVDLDGYDNILTWPQIPDTFKYHQPVKPLKYELDPKNKALFRLMDSFISGDDLREAMMGIYFDAEREAVAATDAHRLAILPYEGKVQGIYNKSGKEIKRTFPQYPAVMPDIEKDEYHYVVDCAKLRVFCETIMRADRVNSVTHQIHFPISDDMEGEVIAFNGLFLVQLLTWFEQMGIPQVDVHMSTPSRGVTFVEPGKKPMEAPTALLMPVVAKGDYADARYPVLQTEVDYKKATFATYSFARNQIYSLGIYYDIDLSLSKKDTWPYQGVSYDQFLNLKKVRPTGNSVLPILDRAAVRDGLLTVTDLETSYRFPCDLPEGLYEVLTDGLIITHSEFEDLDDFPKIQPEGTSESIGVTGRGTLSNAIRFAEPAAVKKSNVGMYSYSESYRYIIIRGHGNYAEVLTTDGHIAAWCRISWEGNPNANIHTGYILAPIAIVAQRGEDEPVFFKRLMRASSDDLSMTILEGAADQLLMRGPTADNAEKIPDVAKMWIKEYTHSLALQASDLQAAFDKLKKHKDAVFTFDGSGSKGKLVAWNITGYGENKKLEKIADTPLQSSTGTAGKIAEPKGYLIGGLTGATAGMTGSAIRSLLKSFSTKDELLLMYNKDSNYWVVDSPSVPWILDRPQELKKKPSTFNLPAPKRSGRQPSIKDDFSDIIDDLSGLEKELKELDTLVANI